MDGHVLIIGGGVAGLAAANQLADQGYPVTLIEAGSYPAHKVCGEFFSPEALPILEQWGVAPEIRISSAEFTCGKQTLNLKFPTPAGSCPRYVFDARLAERAEKRGATLLTHTCVEGLRKEGTTWKAKVGDREIEAPHVIIGTGRLTGQKRPTFPYRGYKAHFRGEAQGLEMHLLVGAYLGISQVADGVINVACLAKGKVDPDSLLPASLRGQQLFDWMEVPAPEFGVRHVPNWENALFVGDAAGTVAPICGEGLAMGVTSGVLAADHILSDNAAGFRQAWLARYAKRITIGRTLHQTLLRAPNLVSVGRIFPKLVDWIFRSTRN